MIKKSLRGALAVAGAFLVLGVMWLSGRTGANDSRVINGDATRQKVVRYIREKFAVPDSVKLTISPLRSSVNPNYYDCSITADDGKQPKSQNVSISKDGRYLAMSSMYELGSDTRNDIVRIVRQAFQMPVTTNVTLGDFLSSPVPGFSQTTVTAGEGAKKQSQQLFVTKDNRYVVLGSVFPLLDAREVIRSISIRDRPTQGPAAAPVTIVEYADLQCPSCARLHEFFENELVPKYEGKVRIVFKDFPLVAIHDWTERASIASQCAYQISPEQFVEYRSLIFRNQSGINATNSRDMLLNLASQAGIDSLKLAACLDSQASRPRVEQDLDEGKRLGVASTPSCYVNGRLVVGNSPEDYYKAVDEALARRR